ncbi:MAG: DUF11 domain-containing protein [Anaerolineales bacterium]|nr:DUF11 domain-containing protein [Anaerolineales bacterium]
MKKLLPPPNFPRKKWFRLGFAVMLALASSLTLLFLPISASRSGQPATMLPFLPFGAEIVRAANGLTVTKIAHAPDVDQGGILTYTLIVTNGTGLDLGPETIIISDTVPADTTCIDVYDSPDSNWLAAQPSLCRGPERIAFWVKPQEVAGLFTFPPGAVAIMTYAVTVTQPLPDQSFITNLSSSYIISAATIFDTGQDTVNTLVNAPVWEISKTANPSPVVEAGSNIIYTITYTNIGHLATSGTYTITEQIPISTTYVPGSAFPTEDNFDGTTLTWVLGSTLDVNDALAVNFTVTVDDPITDAVEIVNNTYSITGGNVFSPAFGLPVSITVDSPVTMTVTKSDFPDLEVIAGELLTYTLTVTNESSSKGPAGNVVISDTLPANTTFVNAGFEGLASGTVDNLGSVVTWTLNSPNPLSRNESASVFVVVRVDSPLDNGTVITNSAYTAAADNGTVTILGLPAVTTTVRSTPTLEISKSDLFDPVIAGGLLTYTIRYTNSGNANATNVIITDTFPASTTFNSESSTPSVTPGSAISGGRQWSLASLPGEGGTGEITLVMDVLSPQAPGTILTNVVSITSSEVSSLSLATETTTITSTPELHIIKLDDPDPVATGGYLTYTIIYSNTGNADANGVTVTDTLPSGVNSPSASDGGTFSNGVVTWSNLSVPANGVDQTLTLSVTIDSDLPNNTILTNEAAIFVADVITTSTITTLVQAPSLLVSKTVSPTGVIRAGDTIEYTITYTNTGSVDIGPPGVNITDTFPVSVTNIIFGSAEATLVSAALPELVWNDSNLPGNGGTGVITITGQVITSPWASTGGQITNTVIVAGSGYSATTDVDIEGQPGLPFTLTVVALPSTQQVGLDVLAGATATDQYGNPVFDGTAITLTTNLSGSTINGASSQVINTTGGEVSAILSSTVAGVTIFGGEIAGTSSTLTDTTVVTFTPGPVARFLVTATSPQTAGVAFPLGITSVDQYGNVVDTFNDSATISDTTGTIVPTGATLANGVVTPSVTITRATTPLSTTITVITGTISGTVNVEILPDDPDDVIVEVAPTTIPICGTANVTTTVIDQYLNRIANRNISLISTIPPANGTVTPNAGNTGSTGFFTSTLQGRISGTLELSAQSGGLLNSSPPTVTVTAPAIPISITLTPVPNPLATGGNTAIATATVFDCLGPSASQVVTFTISDPGLVTLGPITGTTNASGVATTTLTSNASDGTVTITATVGSLITTTNLIINSPALTITKTASPASGQEVRPGNIINYILQATNSGSSILTNVVITDALPIEVTFGTCTPSSGATCIVASNAVTVTTSTLGIGQVLTANVRVTVGSVISGTVLSNQANALSSRTPFTTSNIVSHSVTTATVNSFLPIILKEFVPAPDLVITNFTVTGSDPNRVVTVVVQNTGTVSTGEGFWVDFYVNPSTLPDNSSLGGNRRWELTGSSQGIAWPVPALAAGDSVTLTSDGSVGIAPAPAPLSQWSGSLPSGTNQLYAFVDSFDADGAPFVEIAETNENNNLASQTINVTAGTDLVPSALPDLSQLPPRWQP